MGTEQLKIYIHWILLISTKLFLTALAGRKRAGRHKVHSEGIFRPPQPLWKSRLERWKEKEGKEVLFETLGKISFWSRDARDFEAPVKLLAWIQVMVFPSPQLSAARVFQQRKKRKVVGEREEKLPVHFSATDWVQRAKHCRLTFIEGLTFPGSARGGLPGVSNLV